MPVSPILERQTTYPFVRLGEAARRVEERGVTVIDFGTGDPREPTWVQGKIDNLAVGVHQKLQSYVLLPDVAPTAK